MSRGRAVVAMGMVVALPLITIRYLHGLADRRWFRIDYTDLPAWFAATHFTDAVAAFARPLALAIGYWCLAGTLLYLTAVLTGSRRMVAMVAPFTLPVVRRLADRVVAGSIAIGMLAAPLLASTQPAPASVDVQKVSTAYVPPAHRMLEPAPPPPPVEPDPVSFTDRPVTAVEAEPPPVPPVPPDERLEVVVRPGDSLWTIARDLLSSVTGSEAADHQVAPYWRVVVEANAGRMRSGDPDLIHPGEVVTLPDPTPFIPSGS